MIVLRSQLNETQHYSVMPIKLIKRYVSDHWYGRQDLAWSFWINLVLLRVLVMALQAWLGPDKGQDFSANSEIVLFLALFFHVILFVWQVVGVLRASEVHIRDTGSMALVWGIQLTVIVAFFLVLSDAFGAWQMTLPVIDGVSMQAELDAERAAKYSIAPTSDGKSLTLTGSFEYGITDRFERVLAAHPDVEQVVLSSTGGNIYEARGLGNIIRRNNLNTLVISECSSACTTAFISGTTRQLAADGRLGFHQYWIDAAYPVLLADPMREQTRDRALFAETGVAPWFIDKMFDTEAAEMWFPDIDELVEANVVNSAAPLQEGN